MKVSCDKLSNSGFLPEDDDGGNLSSVGRPSAVTKQQEDCVFVRKKVVHIVNNKLLVVRPNQPDHSPPPMTNTTRLPPISSIRYNSVANSSLEYVFPVGSNRMMGRSFCFS